MEIVDLSLPLFDKMPVYPGDPEFVLEQVFTFAKDGWNMKRMHVNLHDGTHVNVPIHATKNGRTLNTYSIDDFIGKTVIYWNKQDIKTGLGLIFGNQNINWETAKLIVQKKPKFIGLSVDFEFDEKIEKYLLENGIISFERLANMKKLPKGFMFYGVPLNIKDADGSPVRAFAVV